MCTAISYKNGDHYFGRTLDLEYTYREELTVTPRNFSFRFRMKPMMQQHYAIIGIATVSDCYPLYYDAANEAGLSMAGLNFPDNAVYFPINESKDNIAPYELIPWILGQCKTVDEAESLLKNVSIVNIPFNSEFPLTPLHWIIADKNRCVTIEQTEQGLELFRNPVGVLTNNPPFEFHLFNLQNYLDLSNENPTGYLKDKLYSRGIGGFGLPGDLSSTSRFVRAVFTKHYSVADKNELSSVSQFFHILSAVEQQHGCVKADCGFVKTVYTSCCNTNKGIYYYTTYENRQITSVDMHHENLGGANLIRYPLIRKQNINPQN